MVGDSGVGKTSLMVRYVEKRFDQDYVETLGVNFMEKTISTPTAEVMMSLWDLGGDRSFASMLPMVSVESVAMLFMFDLTQKSSLASIREWYRQVRGLNAVRACLCFCCCSALLRCAAACTPPSDLPLPRLFLQSALPFLVGTKYDLFYNMDAAYQEVRGARGACDAARYDNSTPTHPLAPRLRRT